MNKFFKKVEIILLKAIIISLILLTTSQIILNNNIAKNNFLLIKDQINLTLSKLSNSTDSTDRSQSVLDIHENKEGLIKITSIKDEIPSDVYILKNGKNISNFYKKDLVIKVKDGDIVSIDCRNITKELYFKINCLTENITTMENEEIIKINGNLFTLKIIFVDTKI
ncbi:MAG: hypothetical protein ACQEQF_12195 [Bacillota bacterium]